MNKQATLYRFIYVAVYRVAKSATFGVVAKDQAEARAKARSVAPSAINLNCVKVRPVEQ